MSNKEEELSFEWEERKKDVPFYHHIIGNLFFFLANSLNKLDERCILLLPLFIF